jgi:tRNA pseudouridine32 synthase/23S rRNA pseudouridine746 synthase
LPSPFAPVPHPLARRAAEHLKARLGPSGERGKMFGVLVVADGTGRIGYLAAFSGMLQGQWSVEGFVDPVFDLAGRNATWPAVEAELESFDGRLRVLAAEQEAARFALTELEGRQAAVRSERSEAHRVRRGRRQARRAELAEAERASVLEALAQESRADAAADRWLRASEREERGPLAERVRALDEARLVLERQRGARSAELLEELFAGYQIPSARGERRSLRALFAPATPPGGSGDCAAPKLFAQALRAGLRPLAIAELWWGPPPATGGRQHGVFYPACRGKCGPVLAHMLDGLSVDPPPIFGAGGLPAHEPRTVYEDQWLVVVDKPVGLLSVPGRAGLGDSVLTRLRARLPGADGPLIVHRLDLDTSGLMVLAKDRATYHALQAQFFRRQIDKRYVALLEGAVPGQRGAIELALRVDLDDRPRQIHDPVHGKAAITEWSVLSRAEARTRVALYPRTGRTHQLRVHAAHPRGLGAPIVGDRLYGQPAERLMLHAEALAFAHPHTGQRLELVRPAPF